MLSLDKTKSEDEVKSFLGKMDSIAMAKMDGLTCSLLYENGKLVRAETRGNGAIGEDITHNILFVKGVPSTVPIKEEFIVDGEVICTYSDFEEFKDTFKNPRNFASGSIRLLDSKESARRKLTFVAWDCIKGLNYSVLSEKLIKLKWLGFIITPFVSGEELFVHNVIENIKNEAQKKGYPIDGIVFKYDNCAFYQRLGNTEHHFRGGLAFKFYDEEYETYLKNIEWSMGKTGQLTPVAVFEDVDTGDSIINRASLHNINIMRQVLLGRPFLNQRIKVVKMNEIIPQVVWADPFQFVDNPFYFEIPKVCPICGEPTQMQDDFLYCRNALCSGKLINQIDHFCGKKGLDIKGLSLATIEKLMDWGWVNNYLDLFSLKNHRDEWIIKPGFGEKSVDKILESIENGKHCELWQFISALGIPLIGSTYAKQMAKMEPEWFHIREDIEGKFDFTKWAGFGYEMNSSLYRFDYTEADKLAFEILDIHNSIWEDPLKVAPKVLADKKFVITGSLRQFKNRGELQKVIEDNGGKVVSSVSKNTNYLINNDINSTSAKNVSAKKLGIPIITEADLMELLDVDK